MWWHVPEQFLGELHALFGRFLNAFFLEFRDAVLDGMCAVRQAAIVGNLDVQARACVQFKDQRALVPMAPWCRLALPPDWRVGRRSMAMIG